MKNGTSMSLIILSLISTSTAFSQKSKHDLSIYFGYSIGNPDKRYEFLYDQFPAVVQTVIDKSSTTTVDDEYFAGVRYKYTFSDRIKFGVGLGYAQLIQDFLLPADGLGYFMQGMKPFFWRDESQYHMIQLSPSVDVNVIGNSGVLGINIMSTNNVSFHKHINRFNLSRNKLEFFASELYSGIYGEYKRLRADIGFRVLHLKFRDDAISNNGLNPDTYNPLKMRFQLSYVLW